MIALRVLGPKRACKYSFAATVSLLFLLLVSLSSSAKGAVEVYSEAIDDIIEVEAKMSPTNSED
tara:strand:- start:1944 stop:2135 length:192 start_codon:yes stop_codon:yes gene_type:complete